ncbi:hypothetical protein HPB51_008579 [Rhipicephalus microplus]|uniref:Uncharacterized protein n=1 Tax=Rhipicephalus microplus TaxID=6941 RepID=A0A9J6EZR9_RHIMP|nr:hypothetical protein HPB51_008579 [Rhipicephalus microplus]
MQAEVSAADAGLGKKDSLVVLRKRLQENDVNESSNIKINTLLGVAATLLLTILLVIYIVALEGSERPRGLRNDDHHPAPCYLLGPLRPPTPLVTPAKVTSRSLYLQRRMPPWH